MVRRSIALATLLCLAGVLAACGSSSSSSGSTTTAAPVESMRGKRYCEVLLLSIANGTATADVYNSFPLNECPAAQWNALDAKALATANNVPIAMLNGPRYWLMDLIEKQPGAVSMITSSFGGIDMYRQANVDIGPIADAMKKYTAHAVDRSTVFQFDAGRTVYELVDPQGGAWVMQSWSAQTDPNLDEAGLASLGSRLTLPAGWSYRSRVLTEPLRITTTSQAARVLQDDFADSYSRESTS